MSRVTRSSPRGRKEPGVDEATPGTASGALDTPAARAAASDAAAAVSSSITRRSTSRKKPAVVRARSQTRDEAQPSLTRVAADKLSALAQRAALASSGLRNGPPLTTPDAADDDDDPTRLSWGLGGRFSGESAVTDSPVSSLSRALCCAGGRGQLSWLGTGLVCFTLALASLGIHLLLEVLGDKLEVWSGLLASAAGLHDADFSVARALAVLGTLLVIVAVPLTHGIAGVRRHGVLSYSFWQPFVGGVRFVALQVLAWTIWTITVLAGLYGAWVGTKQIATGWFSAVGLGGVISQVLVLVSLHFFVSGVSTKQRAKVGAMKVAAALSLHRTRSEGSVPISPITPTRPHAWRAAAEAAASSLPADTTAADGEPDGRATSRKDSAAASCWPFSSLAMKITFLVIAALSLLLALFVESGAHQGHGVSPISSLLTSAILLAVPITHLLARRSLTHAGYLLFQPFKGGARFVALQAVAWTLWTVAFVSASASFLFVLHQKGALGEAVDAAMERAGHADLTSSGQASFAHWRWISSLVTSAGVGGVLSQALVLLSLKYFDRKLSTKIGYQARIIEMVRKLSVQAGVESATPAATPHASPAPMPTPQPDQVDVYARAAQVLSSPSVLHRQILESPRSLQQLSVTPQTSPHSSRVPVEWRLSPHVSSMRSGTAAGSVEDDENEQDAAPTMLLPPASSFGTPRTSPMSSPGSSIVVTPAEIDVRLSPDTLEPPSSLASLTLGDLSQSFHLYAHQLRSTSLRALVLEAWLDFKALLVVAFFYFVPLVGGALTFIPWVLMVAYHPVPWWLYTLYLTLVLMYLSTYRNKPSLTGSRSWDAVRYNDHLWGAMERYFAGQVVRTAPIRPEKGPYIFGFHPHGVYPTSVLWSTRGPQFRANFPDVHIDVCGASIMFYAPLLRDVCMWTGGREVSGSSLRIALKQQRSILLVPGGQREMRHSVARPDVLTLVTRHKGFIRMAIEHGTPLVPVLSLGETMLLENVKAPRMQKYTLKTFGVGFPIWPYGRWYSPLPNPHPVVVVFGSPITVPHDPSPSVALVDKFHHEYYEQLQQMFLDHRHRIPGWEKCRLEYTDE